jgi:Glycosyl hydrolase family 26
VAAFRHVVQAVRHAGAHNVIWVWTTNVAAPGDCPIKDRYPGDRFVTWVGVDGYMRKPGRTFANIFGQSLAQIHQFTHRPILLAETGVLVGVPGATRRILDLYHGAGAAAGVIGVVYFDAQTRKYGDYRPQDSPGTLAAFRQAVRHYSRRH